MIKFKSIFVDCLKIEFDIHETSDRLIKTTIITTKLMGTFMQKHIAVIGNKQSHILRD